MTRKEKEHFLIVEAEMAEIARKVREGKKLPEVERIEHLNRVMATYLCKHGILPDHLKKFVNH